MIRVKKVKFLVFATLALVLVISLVAGACAKAAPEGAAEEEIAALESKLATEKTKVSGLEGDVSDLEDEIAALKKPAEVQHWEPACWQSAGPIADNLAYFCEHLTAMSDGRIVATPSTPGAICPVDAQLDAVIAGSTEMMASTLSNYVGKIPCFYALANFPYTSGVVADMVNWCEVFEGGRIDEITQEELTKFGDAVIAGNHYFYSSNNIVSAVPIYGLADLEGVMFRTAEIKADLVSHFGAGTVWLPGDEIYTALATGAVDAITYSNVLTNLAMSFHEVSKYWIRQPLMSGPVREMFVVNGGVWRALPDDLQDIVSVAAQAASARGDWVVTFDFDGGWKQAEAYGIEVIEWSAADIATFLDAYAEIYKEKCQVDAPSREVYEIYQRWLAGVGG